MDSEIVYLDVRYWSQITDEYGEWIEKTIELKDAENILKYRILDRF